jgi:DNA helicase HerA-like ATPase
VFFCTQLPTDVPNDVLSQLGARIQHALRAFTPDDQKALTKTVRTYPKTDVYDLASALTSLGIGEAVVTVLSERGAPTPVAWTRLRSPRSLMAAIGDDAISGAAKGSPLQAKYGESVDSRSAYEILNDRAAQAAPADQPPAKRKTAKRAAEKKEPGWFRRFMNSREGRSLFRQFSALLVKWLSRNIDGNGKRRR